jgi:hypothetical protein
MIVDQATLDRIQRLRERTLTLPARRGKLGELKRCPVKPRSVRKLEARVPYDQHRQRAERQPTRARQVLALIDLCQQPTKTLTITVDAVEFCEQHPATWLIRFRKGDLGSAFDRPLYLAASTKGDYTHRKEQALLGEPEVLMPLAEDLAKARAKALEKRISPQQQALGRAASDAETLEQSMKNMKARALVHRAQRNFEAAARLLSDEVVDCSASTAVDGSQGEEERPPHAGAAAASLSAPVRSADARLGLCGQ